MNTQTQQYMHSVQRTKVIKKRLTAMLPVLSLFLIAAVFWWLKLTGITLAGEAFCGKEEHIHTDACYDCVMEEHIHISSCYSDITADLETAKDWEATLTGVSSGPSIKDRIVAVAKSQLGYAESQRNFIVDSADVRHGYTRYGEWYGNPYGDWSAMFTAFCLRYAGLSDAPISSGAETMRLQWEKDRLYRQPHTYIPMPGDIVFLDKNGNGTADATAIITEITADAITVIEGNLNDQVAETAYAAADAAIMGYGISMPKAMMLLTSTAAADGPTIIGKTVNYSTNLFSNNDQFILYTRGTDGNHYAIDGNGNAVRINVDANGQITTDHSNPTALYWTFEYCGTYESQTTYYIQNVATGQYLHPYRDSATNHGAILTGRWESALYQSGNGVKFRGARQNAYAWLENNARFTDTGTLNNASTFYFGRAPVQYAIWLDGTNGGLMSLGGSLDQRYLVQEGSIITLPTQWQSPSKYSYKLQGWYDVKNSRYYRPGDEIVVTEDLVLYADWVASTYDLGQYNSHISDTVSTSDFVTTKLFDYNFLFNVLSESANVTVNASGHTETWNLIANGTVPYKNQQSLNFIFADYDGNGDISYPNNRNPNNTSGDVFAGLYSDELKDILFGTDNAFDPATGTGILGKTYLGTGDHLFQLGTDPTSQYYGYYYYDSRLNAASYQQSEGRFYVYDYLERTSDSEKDGGIGGYSDFLPLNSPYANTNGNTVVTYTYGGEYGEYQDVNHVQYDAKYDSGNNSANNVATNFWFGMQMDLRFYLPDSPGARNDSGEYWNLDVYGKEMIFEFSGDDDVWVLVDGKLVLDLGGIHGAESGTVNFSSGIVTVNGEQTGNISYIREGEHIMTVLYLERGSSQSNCAMYFNLAPRFSLDIQKEDVLTQEVLDGAEFSVYTDKACTTPAQLWETEAAYYANEPATNTFTVKDGVAKIWGFSAGKTYYIQETKAPDSEGYGLANGIICLSLDKRGMASYSVEVIEETDANGNPVDISNGFTVHGFRIDEQNQKAYIVVTNAQDWVEETTTVQAIKRWNDREDHTYHAVTVYLTVTDPDGTVRRIREIALSEENDWEYIWTNLPKYYSDGVTEILYGVDEAYYSGYSPTIEKVDEIVIVETTWAESYSFVNGGVYLLKTNNGCLSTVSASSQQLMWVDQETAENSPLALWTATVSGGKVRLTNGQGQILSFNNGSNSSNRYFFATTSNTSYQAFTPVNAGSGIRIYYAGNYSTRYYISSLNGSGRLSSTTSANSALSFTPMTQVTSTTIQEVEDIAFTITNTPLDKETSLKVFKVWDTGMASGVDYERAQVTIRLLANGIDTGRTLTLSLKNGWTDTFLGLPYMDADGNVILYSVEESWDTEDWLPVYGEIRQVAGTVPTYETTVTNSYRWGHGYELPSTGGAGQTIWILSGFLMMLGSLVCGCVLRRKRERRSDK